MVWFIASWLVIGVIAAVGIMLLIRKHQGYLTIIDLLQSIWIISLGYIGFVFFLTIVEDNYNPIKLFKVKEKNND